MTVEISALLPIILMVLWMFFSYLFYFMNCGIAQGIMEEAVQKAADVKITGAEYDTGKLSYQKVQDREDHSGWRLEAIRLPVCEQARI